MVVWENGEHEEGRLQALQIRTVAGADDFASHARGAHAALRARRWRRGACCPTSCSSTAGAASSTSGSRCCRSSVSTISPSPRLAKRAEEVYTARPPAAAGARPDLARAAHAAADPRRGPPLRDHVPQEAARRAGRSSRCSTASPAWGRRSAPACSRRSARRAGCRAARWPSWPRCPRSRPSWPSGSTTTSTPVRDWCRRPKRGEPAGAVERLDVTAQFSTREEVNPCMKTLVDRGRA